MIKNIVHYVGFLMLLVFMTGSTVYAENNIKNSQFSSNDIVPDINQTLITSIIEIAAGDISLAVIVDTENPIASLFFLPYPVST